MRSVNLIMRTIQIAVHRGNDYVAGRQSGRRSTNCPTLIVRTVVLYSYLWSPGRSPQHIANGRNALIRAAVIIITKKKAQRSS